MITTVVTTVTTVTMIAALGINAILGVTSVITLIAFLATRELASTNSAGLSLRIARFTSIGILPLTIAFVVIIIVKIVEVL